MQDAPEYAPAWAQAPWLESSGPTHGADPGKIRALPSPLSPTAAGMIRGSYQASGLEIVRSELLGITDKLIFDIDFLVKFANRYLMN
jgi:hypothetical protein